VKPHRRPAQPSRPACGSGRKVHQAYLVNAIQEVYRLQGVNINDKHMRDHLPPDDALGQGRRCRRHHVPSRGAVDKFRFARKTIASFARRWASRNRPSAAPWYHQGVALDRLVHLRGPASRRPPASSPSGGRRQGRLPARAEEKMSSWAGSFLLAQVSNTTAACSCLTEVPVQQPMEELPRSRRLCQRRGRSQPDFLSGKDDDADAAAATEGRTNPESRGGFGPPLCSTGFSLCSCSPIHQRPGANRDAFSISPSVNCLRPDQIIACRQFS